MQWNAQQWRNTVFTVPISFDSNKSGPPPDELRDTENTTVHTDGTVRYRNVIFRLVDVLGEMVLLRAPNGSLLYVYRTQLQMRHLLSAPDEVAIEYTDEPPARRRVLEDRTTRRARAGMAIATDTCAPRVWRSTMS